MVAGIPMVQVGVAEDLPPLLERIGGKILAQGRRARGGQNHEKTGPGR